MAYRCDGCHSRNLTRLYSSPTGRKGLSVYVCSECALAQSLPRGVKTVDRTPRLSFGADFGNLRYHKGTMVPRVISFIKRNVDIGRRKRILDIGSNRGDLIEALHREKPGAQCVCVEPDRRVVSSYGSHKWLTLCIDRFENVRFDRGEFDLITCLHTLEHADSARAMLEKIRGLMSARGYLFLEVPHIGYIGRKGIVEEFFSDKHLYHFSPFTLVHLFRDCGLKIMALDTSSRENISVIAVKAVSGRGRRASRARAKEEVLRARRSVADFRANFKNNLRSMRRISQYIKAHRDTRIVLWGAGRIFDAFVNYSDISKDDVAGVIDEYVRYKNVSGFRIYRSRALRTLAPHTIIIFSRSFADEIRARIKTLMGDRVRVVSYEQLLKRRQ